MKLKSSYCANIPLADVQQLKATNSAVKYAPLTGEPQKNVDADM